MAKLKYVMMGTCERCGKELVRTADCDVAACDCQSAVEVPLQPFLIVPIRIYNRFQKVADREKVPIESLVNMVLRLALKHVDDTWERR